MIVLMAGLPGTGKSTIARRVATSLPAALLDKDVVRDVLFSPDFVEYTARQDDFCMTVVLETAGYLLQHDVVRNVILDGRTFSKRYQVEQVEAAATALREPLAIVECVCSEATARRRLTEDAATRSHLAGNRDVSLYESIRARFEPIAAPKLVLDTDEDIAASVARSLAYLTALDATTGEPDGRLNVAYRSR